MAALLCPFCQSPLFQMPLHQRRVHVCPQNHGRGLYLSVLRKWVTDEQLPALDLALRAAVPGLRPCPACRRSMHVAMIAGQRIDICRACSLCWLDPGELERIPQKSATEISEQEGSPVEQAVYEGLHLRVGVSPYENIKGDQTKFPTATLMMIMAFTVVSYLARHAHDQSWFVFQPVHPFAHFGIPSVLALFTHADFDHFLGNSLFFLFAGQLIESTLGEFTLLELFFFCGLAGQLALSILVKEPTIGASGAISGVVMALVLTQPQARVLMQHTRRKFLDIFTIVNKVPITLWAAIWFMSQLSSSLFQLRGQGDGTSYVSHVAGALAGIVYVVATDLKVMVPKRILLPARK